jgi:hypothetical protein
MSEYIDRQALLDAIPSTKEDKQISLFGAVADFISLVCDVPAADVAPVVHAHWKGYHTQDPYCSNCGFSYDREEGEYAQTTDYCGNCGAKMDGGDNIMNTNPECFTPEGNNPYPLCTGKDMPECENCQLRAGWNGGDTDA